MDILRLLTELLKVNGFIQRRHSMCRYSLQLWILRR